MRTPAVPESPGTEAVRRRNLLLLFISIALAVVVVGAVFAYVALQPGAPLDLLSVGVSPSPATPGQPIKVTAQIQGGSFFAPLQASMFYAAFFGGQNSGGGGTMFHGSGESYSSTIGPFSNGTQVWIVVTAYDGHAFALSGNYTLDVGTVVGSGAAGLRINSVVLNPPHPTSIDTPSVTVNVTSSAAVTEVLFEAVYFTWSVGSTSSGATGGGMQTGANGNYTTYPGTLYGLMPNSSGTSVGTIWLYRVSAQDNAGDTALSPVYTFTVAMPAV